MDRGKSAHHCVVADAPVAGECAVVGKDNFVSNGAIVADMAIGEKISPAPNLCLSVAFRAAIHRNEFAKRVFVPDLQIGWLARILEVLALLADRTIGVEFISGA